MKKEKRPVGPLEPSPDEERGKKNTYSFSHCQKKRGATRVYQMWLWWATMEGVDRGGMKTIRKRECRGENTWGQKGGEIEHVRT